MKWFLIFPILLLSCAQSRLHNKLVSKGYNTMHDTVSIKPYEYLIIKKGWVPSYEELLPERNLNVKISIRGYENSDSIPINVIIDPFDLSISDPSIKEIVSGKLHFRLNGFGEIAILPNQSIDSIRISFSSFKKRKRKLNPIVLFFWDVKIRKENVVYSIPARKYYLISNSR